MSFSMRMGMGLGAGNFRTVGGSTLPTEGGILHNGYIYHIFTADGELEVLTDVDVEYVVLAAGGSSRAGVSGTFGTGGGGGGGIAHNIIALRPNMSKLSLSPGTIYIQVAGQTAVNATAQNSKIYAGATTYAEAIGGGQGGATNTGGASGGSGGGAGGCNLSTNPGGTVGGDGLEGDVGFVPITVDPDHQGYDGGDNPPTPVAPGAGGGGFTSPGGDDLSSYNGADGGQGIAIYDLFGCYGSDIGLAFESIGGGGGGGSRHHASGTRQALGCDGGGNGDWSYAGLSATDGEDNRGGGGGGVNSNKPPCKGGSGIVIVRYAV